MAAMLTFYPRRALLEAIATGQAFHVPIYHDRTRIAAWEHVYELRSGKYTLWDHAFEAPGNEADSNATVIYRIAASPGGMEVYDFPGAYAQRFDGVDTARGGVFHSHAGMALYVGTRSSGIYIHALPLCNLKTCIVVLQQWDNLRRAIAGEKRLSFSISV